MNVEELEKQIAVAKNRLDRAIEKITQPASDSTNRDEYEYWDALEAFFSARQELAIVRCKKYVIPHHVGVKPSPSDFLSFLELLAVELITNYRLKL